MSESRSSAARYKAARALSRFSRRGLSRFSRSGLSRFSRRGLSRFSRRGLSQFSRSENGTVPFTSATTSFRHSHAAALADWRGSRLRRLLCGVAVLLVCVSLFGSAAAQEMPNQPHSIGLPEGLAAGPEHWTSPEGLSSAIQVMLLLTVLSLAPAVLLMTTCFVRVVVVLGLLRQAIGTQQLPPSQVITALALFLTLLIMTPVWKQVYDEAIVPYTEGQIDLEQAWTAGAAPIRRFMALQIERTGNAEDVHLFLSYLPDQPTPSDYNDVPLQALLPAFMLSELKTAFLIGFQVYLPFLILDMVIAAVMVSMGMLMLPPVLISLPFKLLLFVLVDGWHLVVGMLLESFQPFT